MSELHTPHECPACAVLAEPTITSLTPEERERLIDALYRSKFGEQGYFGRVECEQFADAMAPAVLHIKLIAFHSGVRWKGQAHDAASALHDLRDRIYRLSRSIYNGAGDPMQEFYDRGFGQWLQNKVDAILERR
jgi:hypothetical protein